MAQKKFQDLNLSDAFLFAAAMEDSEVCRLALEILLNRKIASVAVHTEHSMLYSSDYRSIRLDVYAQDDEGDSYNVEMQGENQGNLPKRSRYHQAKMDVMSIPPGADFNELRPNYVIFICTFDPFGEGLYQYTFENRCREKDIPLNDGTTKLFLNTQGKNKEGVSETLVHFLRYVENTTEECVKELQDKRIEKVHDRVITLKQSREWESRYMKFEELLQDAENRGLQEGLQKGLKQGQSRLLLLISRMTQAGEAMYISRLSEDEDFLQKMYEKYQI